MKDNGRAPRLRGRRGTFLGACASLLFFSPEKAGLISSYGFPPFWDARLEKRENRKLEVKGISTVRIEGKYEASAPALIRAEVVTHGPGSPKQAKGAIKEAAGKLTGDAKLQADGKADKAAGKIQNAIGSVKDALRGK